MKFKSNIFLMIFVALAMIVSLHNVQAQPQQLSPQQIQELKKQYLSNGGSGLKLNGDIKSAGSNKADDIAKEQQAVLPQRIQDQTHIQESSQNQNQQDSSSPQQPLQNSTDSQSQAIAAPASTIETSMRARLTSSLNMGEKNIEDLNGLHVSDLSTSEIVKKHNMASSRKDELLLRSTWERFLENQKIRGVDSNISQFGYKIFSGVPNTFSPATDIPVPPEYVLGPGDELQMQLYGSRDDTLTLVVDRNGTIELPRVGSLVVSGLSFVQVKAAIAEQLNRKAVGVNASVTMGRLRSIRVFVLGDVDHPGSYLVSGLSTMSHALFAAGGVNKNGSLRHIQLKRDGKAVNELDLYEFLLKGNSRGDQRLMAGDVIFIPPVGRVVGVAGLATRPAIYELKDEKSVQDVIQMAGGALSDADIEHLQIDRLSKAGDRILLDTDVGERVSINNGDILMLFSIPGLRTNMVSLLGDFKRPGQYGWHKDMLLSELIKSTDDLLPGAFLDYALIKRTDPLSRSISTLRVSLDALLVKKDSKADVTLQADDQVYVFSKSSIDPLNVVVVSGKVVNPGQYPYNNPMRVLDLLFAAGGPHEDSYLKVAELTRYDVIDGDRRQSSHIEISLSDAIAGKAEANILLKPHDELFIRTISNWKNSAWVELDGEVVHPGKYPVEEGERLSSILQRAGGYTKDAYLPAAFFTRESVRLDEQKQLDELSRRTEAEVTKIETANFSIKDEMLRTRQQAKIESAKRIAEQLKSIRATGRVVMEMDDIRKFKDSAFDLAMLDGDKLIIPRKPDVVQVLGEVYNQTGFVYRRNLDSSDYLKMAGGATRTADIEHYYVVRANGMVDSGSKGWFSSSVTDVEPGDTIIVPQIIEKSNFLDSTLDWSRVMMQVGISLASMKTVGVFK